MFVEPQRTQYDVNFHLFGIPVRVSPWFWALAVLLGMRNSDAQQLLIWVTAVFVSILIHELGHALVIRYYGWTPRVVLYSFGGLAIYDPSFSPWQSGRRVRQSGAKQILISLAGPGAGFALAALIVATLFVTKRAVGFPFVGALGAPLEIAQPLGVPLVYLVTDLLYVNVFWGILNLMPIYPLDGGQVARELFIANSRDGIRQSLTLSFVTAIVLAIFALLQLRATYMAFMFGYMAYVNYTQLNGPFGGGFGGFGQNRPW